MTPYRLVALDLDGTAVPFEGEPRPAVVAAIAAAQARGVKVTIATGRAPITASRYAHRLGIRTPIICFQGGRVVDPQTNRTLHAVALPYELALAVLQEAAVYQDPQTPRWAPLVYQGDDIYLQRLWLTPAQYRAFFGDTWHRLTDFRALPHRPVDKIIFVGEPAALDELRPRLNARFRDQVEIVRSWTLFLEVTPRGATKGRALAWLAHHLGIPREAVLAVGDADNDLSMIRWAGLGVAMGNAPPDVQAAADVVAPPVEEDGVAWVIRQWVLGDTT